MTQNSLFSRPPAPLEQVQSVSRIVDYIKRIISQNKTLAGLRVRGEVSGFNKQPSGRIYFDLKEGADVLKCVSWSSDAASLPPFKDGDEIIAGGDYGTFSQRSQYQLFVKTVELSGVGVLYAQFEALKERFRREGLFDPERKRSLPEFPRRLALVSARGRGAEDFLQTIARRAPFIDVTFVETRVQGDGAQMEIAEAIDKASKLDVDVVVLTRGGGSYEDLFAFNLEPIVRAIVRSKHPVLSAIGHAQDVHLSDYAADRVCETPSNAAQFFGEIADSYRTRVERSGARLQHALTILLNTKGQRFDYARMGLLRAVRENVRERESGLARLRHRLDAQNPQRRLSERGEHLMRLGLRLQQSVALASKSAQQRFEVLRARFEGLNPEAPLARGYAIVTYDGRAVRDAAAVPGGALVEAKVQRGRLQARVEKTLPDG
ncbi:MAG TPA: exodeoxyribonuclease VII large subunit [Candidatus Rubrimentiphilum sp.]|nr:exodeoxyribonuclease VII large subunit [Candidatus Rubrimentiphilum sp.]